MELTDQTFSRALGARRSVGILACLNNIKAGRVGIGNFNLAGNTVRPIAMGVSALCDDPAAERYQ